MIVGLLAIIAGCLLFGREAALMALNIIVVVWVLSLCVKALYAIIKRLKPRHRIKVWNEYEGERWIDY